jgi:hypothetical protein
MVITKKQMKIPKYGNIYHSEYSTHDSRLPQIIADLKDIINEEIIGIRIIDKRKIPAIDKINT